MKKRSLIFSIVLVIAFSSWIIGCGGDDTEGDPLDELYKELVGTYDLFKAELVYPDQPTQVFVPPVVSGTMTITSNRKLTQTLAVFGVTVSVSGTFEIRPDENVLLIDNETTDLISKPTYTWDGSVLTTTLDTGAFAEKDFWRKL